MSRYEDDKGPARDAGHYQHNQVQHSDYMNDMVLLAIDRDSWKSRAERLTVALKKLLQVTENIDVCHDKNEWTDLYVAQEMAEEALK